MNYGLAFRMAAGVSVFLSLPACKDSHRLEMEVELKDYASGSALTYFRDKLYVVGDDMNYIYVADSSFKKIDTIRLFESSQKRLPKDIKPDLESATITWQSRTPSLLCLGSGSIPNQRTKGWLVDPAKKQYSQFDLTPFYTRLKSHGIPEVNIEGVAAVQSGIILANRGNRTHQQNFLVFTNPGFWNNQLSAPIRLVRLLPKKDSTSFSGISGLEYSRRSDRLLLTVSTENTFSSHEDGAIGKSYLWIINDISNKRRLAAINPDIQIDLESIDERFKGHKVESACIMSENRNEMVIAIVADDDRGTSLLFKVKLVKKRL